MTAGCRLIILALLSVALLAPSARAGSYETELLALINAYRTANDLKPLVMRPAYEALALAHSRAMRASRRMSHDGFEKRFNAAVAQGAHGCVENVGWNYDTPQAQFDGWQHSPGHNRNMLDPQISGAGIAKAGPYTTFFACY